MDNSAAAFALWEGKQAFHQKRDSAQVRLGLRQCAVALGFEVFNPFAPA